MLLLPRLASPLLTLSLGFCLVQQARREAEDRQRAEEEQRAAAAEAQARADAQEAARREQEEQAAAARAAEVSVNYKCRVSWHRLAGVLGLLTGLPPFPGITTGRCSGA